MNDENKGPWYVTDKRDDRICENCGGTFLMHMLNGYDRQGETQFKCLNGLERARIMAAVKAQ